MTKKPVTVDDIIESIKVRLGDVDFEILDAKSRIRSPVLEEYYEGVLDSLVEEKQALEQIMRGEYGRKGND